MISNEWKYVTVGELIVREIFIDTGRTDETVIVHLTDLHYKDCNANDLKNPVLASTFKERWAFDTKYTVPNARAAMDYADTLSPDQIVITGDAIDYLSEGSLELLKKEVWDRYRDSDGRVRRVLVTMGNHEPLRQMQGLVEDTTSLESRIEYLEKCWEHNIYYTSRILNESVMVIQMDNSTRADAGNKGFWDCQVEPFEKDLALARENGYAVLLFYHIPLSTGKPEDVCVSASMIGDKNGAVANLYNGGVVGAHCSEASEKIYRMIVSNADIIRGAFCGHNHNDYYTEIAATTQTGEAAVIPQYVLLGTPYQKGHLLKITVR